MLNIISVTLRRYLPMLTAALCLTLLSGCYTKKKVLYLQDLEVGVPVIPQEPKNVRVEPGDKISIGVSSSNPELTSVFNLLMPANERSNNKATRGGGGSGTTTGAGLYTISDKGEIDFPVLGYLKVGGLTRQEIADMIKKRLIEGKYVADPVVSVEFVNLHFTMIGDIGTGIYNIDDDVLTIIEAIAMAGDLTSTSERDQIYVIRTEDGVINTIQLDVRTKDVFNSPGYYIKQNDIIYVVPNTKKRGEYSLWENQYKTPAGWISVFSLVVSLSTFIIALVK